VCKRPTPFWGRGSPNHDAPSPLSGRIFIKSVLTSTYEETETHVGKDQNILNGSLLADRRLIRNVACLARKVGAVSVRKRFAKVTFDRSLISGKYCSCSVSHIKRQQKRQPQLGHNMGGAPPPPQPQTSTTDVNRGTSTVKRAAPGRSLVGAISQCTAPAGIPHRTEPRRTAPELIVKQVEILWLVGRLALPCFVSRRVFCVGLFRPNRSSFPKSVIKKRRWNTALRGLRCDSRFKTVKVLRDRGPIHFSNSCFAFAFEFFRIVSRSFRASLFCMPVSCFIETFYVFYLFLYFSEKKVWNGVMLFNI